MAVDDAIFAAVVAGQAPPTLRLYAWSPPCLSLGYGQRAADVDLGRLEERGWGLVRRPTGGRAILHADELTYSLALPPSHPLARLSIVESYRAISTALVHALAQLGAQVGAGPIERRPAAVGPVCFELASHYEVTVDGRKLVGSAQVRRGGGLLQHGSLPLTGDVACICDVLAYPDESARATARERVTARATTLAAALGGHTLPWDEVASAVVGAFAAAFGVELVRWRALTPAEERAAARLHDEVYDDANRLFAR